MATPRRPVGRTILQQAFEEIRFGAPRTLNLRATLPSAAEAVQRAEAWLRQHQVQRSVEVLLITGRGNNSDGGVSKVREATMRLLHEMRRKGVVSEFSEHNAGAFVVMLAPFRAMIEAPNRRREQTPPAPAAAPATLAALDPQTRQLLRALADRSLDALGVRDRWSFMESEMLRLFGTLAVSAGTGPDREVKLRQVIIAALREYD